MVKIVNMVEKRMCLGFGGKQILLDVGVLGRLDCGRVVLVGLSTALNRALKAHQKG